MCRTMHHRSVGLVVQEISRYQCVRRILLDSVLTSLSATSGRTSPKLEHENGDVAGSCNESCDIALSERRRRRGSRESEGVRKSGTALWLSMGPGYISQGPAMNVGGASLLRGRSEVEQHRCWNVGRLCLPRSCEEMISAAPCESLTQVTQSQNQGSLPHQDRPILANSPT